ncbi:hypothetical protein AB5J55_35255 [Streptomyces sp. R11]|uniref:Uncharacterized protein n=1 Tax=Streptomyces sp. R11 TaxID=3238625 RepID=A0AB39N9C2_9ACTN
MAIEKTFEGGPFPGVPRPVYRVVGDPKWLRTFPTREAAEAREAELAEQAAESDD